MVLGIAMVAAASCRTIAAAALSNGGLLIAVHAARCQVTPCPSDTRLGLFPPAREAARREWVRRALQALAAAHALEPAAVGPAEHLIELRFALDDVEVSTDLFEQLAARRALRPALLAEGRPLFHLLRSRSAERRQDWAGARDEALRGLALAKYGLGDLNEAREVTRIGTLSVLLARARLGTTDEAASGLDAALAAACAGDWITAGQWADRSIRNLSLSAREQGLLTRLLAFRARQSRDRGGERSWLGQSGDAAFDQWTIGDPYLWLGRELESIGLDRCTPGAIDVYRWYSSQQHNSAQGLYLEAGVRYWRAEIERAREAATAGLVRDPQHIGCHTIRALAFESAGEFAASRESYLRALALDPGLAEVWARLGRVEHQLRRDGEAGQAFERALALQPDNAQVGVLSALFFRELGRQRRACELFQRVVDRHPENAAAARGAADCQRRDLR